MKTVCHKLLHKFQKQCDRLWPREWRYLKRECHNIKYNSLHTYVSTSQVRIYAKNKY